MLFGCSNEERECFPIHRPEKTRTSWYVDLHRLAFSPTGGRELWFKTTIFRCLLFQPAAPLSVRETSRLPVEAGLVSLVRGVPSRSSQERSEEVWTGGGNPEKRLWPR